MNYFNEELLQSYVRGASAVEEEEPSRLYPQQQKLEEKEKIVKEKVVKKQIRRDSAPQPRWSSRRKPTIVIEQRKFKTVPLAIDECYCDKDRAAAVSFGYMDIKHDLKQKNTSEKQKVRIMPDDTDAMAFLMLGMREIKYNNLDNGVRFLSKVEIVSLKMFPLIVFTFRPLKCHRMIREHSLHAQSVTCSSVSQTRPFRMQKRLWRLIKTASVRSIKKQRLSTTWENLNIV